MQEKLEKYIDVLLKFCLSARKSDSLLVAIPAAHIELSRIIAKKAYEFGIKDVHFEMGDAFIKHEQLLHLSEEEMKKDRLWNKQIYNEYAEKRALFLSFTSEYPGLMKDIDVKKINNMTKYVRNTTLVFDDLRNKSEIPWCIAAVPSQLWAEKVFPNDENAYQKLWDTILDICLINEPDPVKCWKDKLKKLEVTTKKLNKLKIKTLHYTNSLGTDLIIELPKKHLWVSAGAILKDGRKAVFNMPSEEIFSAPIRTGVNGIVYSALPLIHNGVLIDNFNLTFVDGCVSEIHAEVGEEMLKEMIVSDPKGNMLGEVALVPYDSPIRNSETIFYETLFDENASCHLALGQGYNECIEGHLEMTKKELVELGVNDALMHVDFMIGTSDLDIVALTHDNKEIKIFENGNFNI